MGELTAQRTATLRVEVMRRPDLELIGVAHALALPVFFAHAYQADSCFEVRVSDVGSSPRVIDPAACPALQAIDDARETWGSQLPGDVNELWAWLVDQPQDRVMELLAFLASGASTPRASATTQGPRG